MRAGCISSLKHPGFRCVGYIGWTALRDESACWGDTAFGQRSDAGYSSSNTFSDSTSYTFTFPECNAMYVVILLRS